MGPNCDKKSFDLDHVTLDMIIFARPYLTKHDAEYVQTWLASSPKGLIVILIVLEILELNLHQ